MAKNKIDDLRNHLFETLEALKDSDNPMALDRAKAVCEVAQTLINTAKVEVELVKAMSGTVPRGGFFNVLEESREVPQLVSGGVTRDAAFAKRR